MSSDREDSESGVVVGGLSGCLDLCYRAQTDRKHGCSHCLGCRGKALILNLIVFRSPNQSIGV